MGRCSQRGRQSPGAAQVPCASSCCVAPCALPRDHWQDERKLLTVHNLQSRIKDQSYKRLRLTTGPVNGGMHDTWSKPKVQTTGKLLSAPHMTSTHPERVGDGAGIHLPSGPPCAPAGLADPTGDTVPKHTQARPHGLLPDLPGRLAALVQLLASDHSVQCGPRGHHPQKG